jgi:hypothetical protein
MQVSCRRHGTARTAALEDEWVDRRPVSRVLSVPGDRVAVHRTVIPLDERSPARSSSLPAARRVATPWSRRAVSRRLFGLAPAGVCRATRVATGAVGSYPTLSPLPPLTHEAIAEAVCFLLHCPSREARAARAQALPGNLPCGARTFLGGVVQARSDATVRPATTHWSCLQYTRNGMRSVRGGGLRAHLTTSARISPVMSERVMRS